MTPMNPSGRVRVDIYDALAIAGLLLVEWGVTLWSPPAALVLGGCVLVAVAIWPEIRKVRR